MSEKREREEKTDPLCMHAYIISKFYTLEYEPAA